MCSQPYMPLRQFARIEKAGCLAKMFRTVHRIPSHYVIVVGLDVCLGDNEESGYRRCIVLKRSPTSMNLNSKLRLA